MKEKNNTRENLLDITFAEVYRSGYHATAIGTILKEAKVPKGSLYHFFDSKKSLVIAMIKERLFPKMDTFFDYTPKAGVSIIKNFEQTFLVMSRHELMVTYGCPLHRLMVELSAVDREFDALLLTKQQQMHEGIRALLQEGIDRGEFDPSLDPDSFASFIIASTWGVLSLSPSLSSSKGFYRHTQYILALLKTYSLTK